LSRVNNWDHGRQAAGLCFKQSWTSAQLTTDGFLIRCSHECPGLAAVKGCEMAAKNQIGLGLEVESIDAVERALVQAALLRLPVVLKIVGVGQRTWLRLVSEGAAPAPVRVSDMENGAVAWRLPDIQRWSAARPSARAARTGAAA
jgi:predicted DNA-binding transcriptional regulator AlpA